MMANHNFKTSVILLLLGLARFIHTFDFKFEHHLEHFIGIRNPSASDSTPWVDARNYIYDQFRSYGLKVESHPFNTSVNFNHEDKTVRGVNILGIAEGPPEGPVLLIGADYDTSLLQTSPLEDNGAGVAALLEVARNYMQEIYVDENHNRTGTVMFVAFDVNTREYDGTSAGQPGSYHFLHQWLWPYLRQSSKLFRGAFILDSISKYNMEGNSQFLPDGFSKLFPAANEDITKGGFRGDFLTLITRKSKRSSLLSQTLFNNYEKDRKANVFRLIDLTIHDGAEVGDAFSMFDHQAHYHFWTFQPANESMPLPAILLTDTDVYRKSGDPCQSPCKASGFLTNTKNAFITKTSEALLQTLADLQTDRPNSNSGKGLVPSFFIMFVMVFWAKIFQ